MVYSMKDCALKYAVVLGLPVFPLKPKGKTPLTRHGFKEATTNPKQISAWWDNEPMANIGIATGGPAGLLVIDLDVDEEKGIDGRETLRKWEGQHGKLPDHTWLAITGRGGYHYFYHDPFGSRSGTGLYEGIDIRGDGGYIVAPPSVHPNGRRYEWEQSPEEFPLVEAGPRVNEFLHPAPEKWGKSPLRIPDQIPEGGRVNAMVKLTCSLQSKGLSDEAIRTAVRAENEEKCIPPLTDQELEKEVFPALKRYEKGTRPYHGGAGSRPANDPQKEVSLVSMADIREEETTWLYQPYVPRGKITICAAYPGAGKTYLLCYMTACVSSGRSFFSQPLFIGKPGKVIYLTAEDGIGDTIKKRLRICGANMTNIATVLDKTRLAFDSPEIENYMRDYKPDLMIFDPFQAYIGAEIDMNAPNRTREKLGYISELAEKYDVAVVLICHFNKNSKGDAITRVLGSMDIMGICRSYIAVGRVPGSDNTKFMSHEKSSLDRHGNTILFEIDPDRGGVVYMGENNLTMDDYTAIQNKKRTNSAPAVEAAKIFLTENMPEGRRPAKELMDLASAMNISERSLRRARGELGIVVKKTKEFPPRSVWILPGHIEDEP